VKRSWHSAQDAEDIRCEIDEFETIWQGRDPGLLVLSLPRAVQEHLVAFLPPDDPPGRDPMEIDVVRSAPALRDRIAAQWWLDAPKRPGGAHLMLHPLWTDGAPFKPSHIRRRCGSALWRRFRSPSCFVTRWASGKLSKRGWGCARSSSAVTL